MFTCYLLEIRDEFKADLNELLRFESLFGMPDISLDPINFIINMFSG